MKVVRLHEFDFGQITLMLLRRKRKKKRWTICIERRLDDSGGLNRYRTHFRRGEKREALQLYYALFATFIKDTDAYAC